MEKTKTKKKTKPGAVSSKKKTAKKTVYPVKSRKAGISPKTKLFNGVKKTTKKATKKKTKKYIEAIGKRKTAVARVRLFTQGDKEIIVNDKTYTEYFPTIEMQQIVIASLRKLKSEDRFKIVVKAKGGGIHAQAEAIRHGIARALVEFNPDFKKKLKKAGFLTRDSRMRERKKFGLKRARRAPQWRKR